MGGRKKPLLQLCGRSILHHTLDVLQSVNGCRQIVPVLHPDECARGRIARQMREQFGVRDLACGGETRQQSVSAGLELTLPDVEVVLIHDAVRPLVSPLVVEAVVRAASRWGAAIAGVPAVHTVKQVGSNETVERTLPRGQLWFAHTPQGFRRELILHAHRQAAADGLNGTDDAQLVEHLDTQVHLVQDSRYNIKITTPEDLVVAEAILRWRQAHANKAVDILNR